jgi:hypothetical protein
VTVLKTKLLRILPVILIYGFIIEIIRIVNKTSPSGPCNPGIGVLLFIFYLLIVCPITIIFNTARLILKKTNNPVSAIAHLFSSLLVVMYFFCLG